MRGKRTQQLKEEFHRMIPLLKDPKFIPHLYGPMIVEGMKSRKQRHQVYKNAWRKFKRFYNRTGRKIAYEFVQEIQAQAVR